MSFCRTKPTLVARIALLFCLIIPTTCLVEAADDLAAKQTKPELWFGTLDTGVLKLRLLVKLTRSADGLTAVLVSLDQGAVEIPVDEIVLDKRQLTFRIARIQGVFEGKLNAARNQASGDWAQFGNRMGLTLARVDRIPAPEKRLRPQTPQPPFPYRSVEVKIENRQDSVTLAGTLTMPAEQGEFAAAVLITGSGPQDRDETILGHKPFLVLADHLTRLGIAVLRFDDRGFGASTGNFATGTTLDFANDVRAAVKFLANHPEIDGRRIGLIGHSCGGLIAPLIAADREDTAFVVLIAGPGVPGAEILPKQTRLIARANGIPAAEVEKSIALQRLIIDAVRQAPQSATAKAVIDKAIENHLASLPAEQREAARPDDATIQLLAQLATPWFRFFLDHDPRPVLTKVQCPLLALFGELDLQVDRDQNLPELRRALQAGDGDFKVVEFPGLNHLMQPAATGSPAEYGKIEQTIAPVVLKTIGDWILVVLES